MGLSDKYCSEIYPSELANKYDTNSFGNYFKIEEGYIECCREKYNNHKKDTECKVFP